MDGFIRRTRGIKTMISFVLDEKDKAELRNLIPTLVLASDSVNRRELLHLCNIEVFAYKQDINEDINSDSVLTMVKKLAEEKMKSYINSKDFNKDLIAASFDTLVEFNKKPIGKAKTEEEAYQTILSYSKQSQEVHTGFSIYKNGHIITKSATSRVIFKEITPSRAKEYIATGEWIGAAGSYRIQKQGLNLIEKIEGSITNVVGFPIEELIVNLKAI